ncbi:hypothetical protein [Blastomonas sp. UPD001]|jgi:Na+-transporting methylmalonyl-CoA/oxaloacetate decarboxylase gamma subunit|uniref:hypothetical protein n=1 Tax=Blastomonas sp. UPD001 TaxID=2217673 RepID=UPI000E356BF4|nr:hypothetical protein [Blastomonas sp. UPD001]
MKKSTRALVGLVVLELVILIGAWWLVSQVQSGAMQAPDPGAAITQITQTAGGAMGIIAVVLVLAFVHHRRKGN